MQWLKIESSAYETMIELLPKPLSQDIALADLGCLRARLEDLGIPLPGPRALSRRWGWNFERARRLASQLVVNSESVASQQRVSGESVAKGSNYTLETKVVSSESVASQLVVSGESVASQSIKIDEVEISLSEPSDKNKNKIKNREQITTPAVRDFIDPDAGVMVVRNHSVAKKTENALSLHAGYLEEPHLLQMYVDFVIWFWRKEAQCEPPIELVSIWEAWCKHRWQDGALEIFHLIDWIFSSKGQWWREKGHAAGSSLWGLDKIASRIANAMAAHTDTAISLEDKGYKKFFTFRDECISKGISYNNRKSVAS